LLEVTQKSFAAPPPLPVVTARPAGVNDQNATHFAVPGPPPPPPNPVQPGASTDKVAVASSICGLTPFIPIFSQLIGLALGVWALFRIRRARRTGLNVRGRGWATAGIAGNGFVLLGWIALFGTFAALKGTLADTTQKLHPLLQQRSAHHLRVRK
jgi:hypothetical protein